MIIDKIVFGIMDSQMIKKLSVANITKTDLYDQEGYPIEGGLMDPRLGVVDPGVRCRTCGGSIGDCQGHFGLLQLTRPIIHVHYAKIIFTLLKMFCRDCSRILVAEKDLESFKEKGLALKELAKSTKKKCPWCTKEVKKWKFVKPSSFQEGAKLLDATTVRSRLEKITNDDLEIINFKIRPENLILTILPVPPVTVRPSITLQSGERSEDDLTHKLVDIVRINERLKENIDLGAPEFIIEDLWELLQYHISTYFDNDITGVPPARHRSGRILKTISQRLKTKEGRFRGNLAGKRVNFCARTVTSPDPKINIDEVGVPLEIAKELTIPINVTENNIKSIQKNVLNGTNIWPGANYVIRPDGRRKKITDMTKEEIAKELTVGYIVERHIQNGDVSLFNRQPSLHRMSIMGHRIRIMPNKTMRLNLCVTTPYNADFDGDEMNLHIPQTLESQAETDILMAVPKNIRSPRFSGPIIGAVRDHLSGIYLITQDKNNFTRDKFVQLIRSVNTDIEIPNKSSITGKEIFSLFLPKDFSYEGKSKSGNKVIIENGKLIEGVIDKASIGAENGKLLDKLEKLYGPKITRDFLFDITRLAIEYTMWVGFSISISDQDISKEGKEKIKKTIEILRKEVDDLIEEYENGKIKLLPGRSMKDSLEVMIKRKLNKTLDDVENIMTKSLPESNTLTMAKSGARGDLINIVQTAAMVGQEMAMSGRMERGYHQRIFPHFKKNDISLESRGFVAHGFKDGLTPFEFFFDAMNSRESLMDKSLKTRHSGYMERRLVGAMQDMKVEYDGTIRDAINRIVQFTPGEDGLDPSRIERGGINVKRIADKLFK